MPQVYSPKGSASLKIFRNSNKADPFGPQNARTGDQETGITRIFDQQQVQQEIDAQVRITQLFGQSASKAVDDYVTVQRKELQSQLKEATSKEGKSLIQSQIDALNTEERVMGVLIGAVTGQVGVAAVQAVLAEAADQARQESIRNSELFPGVTDGTTTLSNVSGDSDGVKGDGLKIGGTRVDLDNICGLNNERCKANPDGTLALNDKGQVQFDPSKAGDKTLAEFLASPEGQKASGPTGGIQGAGGTMFGIPYPPGSFLDKLVEAFSGTHDYIGGQITGLYDEQGNIKRGMTSSEQTAYNVWSGAAIPVAAPFAAATALPPEVWQAISALITIAK